MASDAAWPIVVRGIVRALALQKSTDMIPSAEIKAQALGLLMDPRGVPDDVRHTLETLAGVTHAEDAK